MVSPTKTETTRKELWDKFKVESDKADEMYFAAKKQERHAHAVWLKWKKLDDKRIEEKNRG